LRAASLLPAAKPSSASSDATLTVSIAAAG
jgi:hypothetical protein